MSLRLRVEAVRELPLSRLQLLFAESAAQGWNHLARLREEWRQGLNRFNREGEALYLATHVERIIAVGGVNLEPYFAPPGIGRVRRVYVLAAYRQRNVGRALVERLIRDSRRSFVELHLRAGSAQAAAFFEALGFEPTTRSANATHRLVLA